MNSDLQNRLENVPIYKDLKKKCMEQNQLAVLALVQEVGYFAIMRLKTVIKNMPEFTLHDDTHIFNMLVIIGKIIPKSSIDMLSIPDLLMLVLSVFLHDIGMAPDEKHILAWKDQSNAPLLDNELEKEKNLYKQFRMTYTHQLSDIERMHAEGDDSRAELLEDCIITEYIRITHAQRARKIMADYWADRIVYEDTDSTEDLATICFSHNESYTFLLNMESFKVCGQDTYLCIPFVVTMLRLADIIDFDPKRTPQVLFSHLAVKTQYH